MKKKRRNPNAITESQIAQAVKTKYLRMKDHLRGNPNNTIVAQRLAEFKKLHASKLKGL